MLIQTKTLRNWSWERREMSVDCVRFTSTTTRTCCWYTLFKTERSDRKKKGLVQVILRHFLLPRTKQEKTSLFITHHSSLYSSFRSSSVNPTRSLPAWTRTPVHPPNPHPNPNPSPINPKSRSRLEPPAQPPRRQRNICTVSFQIGSSLWLDLWPICPRAH